MKAIDPHNHKSLQRQLLIQKRHHWDLEDDIPWQLGIDLNRQFLPLDEANIAFPGASAEQQLALSQLMGLVVNATIAEMEDALPKLKYAGWESVLKSYPANPELIELGELFFEEEAKHARAFNRFLGLFCETTGIELNDLKSLLPQAFGSFFQRAVLANATAGGHAFWWVVSSVEEVSIEIFHHMQPFKQQTDPLFYELHRKHLEEESRHANYAHLMLTLVRNRNETFLRKLLKRTDFAFSQMVATPWVLSELAKFFEIKKFRHKHPFFEVLTSCLPLLQSMPKQELVKRMFLAAPYVSWLLNPKHRRWHSKLKKDHGAWDLPYPSPTGVKHEGEYGTADIDDSGSEHGLADQPKAG